VALEKVVQVDVSHRMITALAAWFAQHSFMATGVEKLSYNQNEYQKGTFLIPILPCCLILLRRLPGWASWEG
jgi:hypothetical protein